MQLSAFPPCTCNQEAPRTLHDYHDASCRWYAALGAYRQEMEADAQVSREKDERWAEKGAGA